ncbi:MAG: hypothetical protein IPH15_03960 [Comamonadaceae bacterium]|nr:hypothetical protein [Comamonadaceae bacterium]
MSTLELQPMALPARGRPSAPALLVAAAVHLVLLWALLQSPPVERAARQVIYQILQPVTRPVVRPPPPEKRPVAPATGLARRAGAPACTDGRTARPGHHPARCTTGGTGQPTQAQAS